MSHAFAKAWDHKLRIKSIFMDAPEMPSAAETTVMAQAVAEKLRELRNRLTQTDDLWHDLDNCADAFDELEGIENAYEARDRFNAALAGLYDEADYGKRVWIE